MGKSKYLAICLLTITALSISSSSNSMSQDEFDRGHSQSRRAYASSSIFWDTVHVADRSLFATVKWLGGAFQTAANVCTFLTSPPRLINF